MIILNILFALSMLGISYTFKKFYPREINIFVGYRTRRSMASAEAWNIANKYASELLFSASMAVALIQVILNFIVVAHHALIISAGLWLAFLILTIIQTELKLKRRKA
jgi:hypothetical protein